MTVLRSWSRSDVPLLDAVDVLADGVALLSGRERFVVARLSRGELQAAPRITLALDDVYSARVFDGEQELRWQLDQGKTGSGRAVLLALGGADGPIDGWTELRSVRDIEAIEQRYLLWGRCRAVQDGWAELADWRVGIVPVPVPAGGAAPKRDERAQLVSRELWCANGPNTTVVEELLWRLEFGDAIQARGGGLG